MSDAVNPLFKDMFWRYFLGAFNLDELFTSPNAVCANETNLNNLK